MTSTPQRATAAMTVRYEFVFCNIGFCTSFSHSADTNIRLCLITSGRLTLLNPSQMNRSVQICFGTGSCCHHCQAKNEPGRFFITLQRPPLPSSDMGLCIRSMCYCASDRYRPWISQGARERPESRSLAPFTAPGPQDETLCGILFSFRPEHDSLAFCAEISFFRAL